MSESVDKHLGRKALVVDGDVPAAHFVRLPEQVGKPQRQQAAASCRFARTAERSYAAHVDLVRVDRARLDRADASVERARGAERRRVTWSYICPRCTAR